MTVRKVQFKRGLITLYLRDARDVLPRLRRPIDTLMTDPPYGVRQDNNCDRFTNPARPRKQRAPHVRSHIIGDDRPFDPTPWLGFRNVVLFGANCYSDRLPKGTWFVWCKRPHKLLGKFCGDAEVAWHNRGRGVYIFDHVWNGFNRETERGLYFHPHQKPVALFEWILSRIRKPTSVFDPFAGSASIGEACYRRGIRYVGAEIDPVFFERAVKRLSRL